MAPKGNDAAAMDIDDRKSAASDQTSNTKFSVNVLQLLKKPAEMQHGLRVDYTRYRRYCETRVRRICKSLKSTHSRERFTPTGYITADVTVHTVTEVRFLHLVLYVAERAWSHAMLYKPLSDVPNARQRSHFISRLRKALKLAKHFKKLCALKADSRTSLEAKAYVSYLKGSIFFERDEKWDMALTCFKSARAVYEKLGKSGNQENKVLCRERVEELEPSIRYCLNKISESNLQTSEMEGPSLDIFRAKVEVFMARSQQAASTNEFHWLGHIFPISNAKTRASILKAQELEKDVNGPTADSVPAEKKLAIFDKVFAAYNEARSCIHNDLANTGNCEGMKDELSGLDKAIGAVLGERTIERNQLLVHLAKSKLSDDKNEKVTKPEELVRLYDLLLQNTADLSGLVSSGRDRNPEEVAFSENCELKSFVFQAERCFYLAKSYSLSGEKPEAYALYCKARSLIENAINKLQSSTHANQFAVNELTTLYNECGSNICVEQTTGIMEEENAAQNLSNQISNISLTGE